MLSTLVYGTFALAAGMAQTTGVNNPPKDFQILAFPQRDFISASGYADGDKVIVKVIHSTQNGGAIRTLHRICAVLPEEIGPVRRRIFI